MTSSIFQGSRGPAGVPGRPGRTGADGSKNGSPGFTGSTGPRGGTGSTGPQGVRGPPGQDWRPPQPPPGGPIGNVGNVAARKKKCASQNLLSKIPLGFFITLNNDVIMGTMASQITSLTRVCSNVYSGADQRNIKAPRHWPLWGENTGDRWIPRTNGQ